MNTKMRSTIAGITLLSAVGLISILVMCGGGAAGSDEAPMVEVPAGEFTRSMLKR